MIQELKNFERKAKLPKMLVSEVDALLANFNLEPTQRIAFKSMLVGKKIMEENYTPVETPFALSYHGRR